MAEMSVMEALTRLRAMRDDRAETVRAFDHAIGALERSQGIHGDAPDHPWREHATSQDTAKPCGECGIYKEFHG